jgi:peptidyl-prolyl cis-trans isomerase B (cyclophilin B)
MGLALTAAATAAGCGGSATGARTTTVLAGGPPAAAHVSPLCRRAVAAPAGPRHAPPPRGRVSRSARLVATLDTSCGTIRIALDARDQPRTVASFVYLARRGFYTGLTFDRVSRTPAGQPFAVFGGDPLGNGRGGPGYQVVERPPPGTRYVRGTVAMQRTYRDDNRDDIGPPGASGSAFFIVTARLADLPAEYAVLGHVTGDDAALARITALPTRRLTTERPLRTVVIRRVSVAPAG